MLACYNTWSMDLLCWENIIIIADFGQKPNLTQCVMQLIYCTYCSECIKYAHVPVYVG